MGARAVAAFSGGRVLRLLVLLAVLAGLVPGAVSVPAADPGALVGVAHAAWSEECSAPPRVVRVGEQLAVPAVEPSVFVPVCPPPVVAGVRGRAGKRFGWAWFVVARAGRAPPFSSGI